MTRPPNCWRLPRKIDPAQRAHRRRHRLRPGAGCGLREPCARSTHEIWKVGDETLAYPNAELVRQALVRVLPPRLAFVLVPHTHFGVDLAPGLSIKMDAAYLPDVLDIDGRRGNGHSGCVRQEFGDR